MLGSRNGFITCMKQNTVYPHPKLVHRSRPCMLGDFALKGFFNLGNIVNFFDHFLAKNARIYPNYIITVFNLSLLHITTLLLY